MTIDLTPIEGDLELAVVPLKVKDKDGSYQYYILQEMVGELHSKYMTKLSERRKDSEAEVDVDLDEGEARSAKIKVQTGGMIGHKEELISFCLRKLVAKESTSETSLKKAFEKLCSSISQGKEPDYGIFDIGGLEPADVISSSWPSRLVDAVFERAQQLNGLDKASRKSAKN